MGSHGYHTPANDSVRTFDNGHNSHTGLFGLLESFPGKKHHTTQEAFSILGTDISGEIEETIGLQRQNDRRGVAEDAPEMRHHAIRKIGEKKWATPLPASITRAGINTRQAIGIVYITTSQGRRTRDESTTTWSFTLTSPQIIVSSTIHIIIPNILTATIGEDIV
jgi:hypothetical protein